MRYALIFPISLMLIVPGNSQDQPIPSWPQFRGSQGRGVATDSKPLPDRFGPEKLVLWKTPLPEGISSPCIWGEKIFLTGFDAKKHKLETLCLNRGNGAILWRQPAPAEKIERVYTVNSPAAATPATDGKRVIVSFGSFGLLCYDMAGKELWRHPLPRPPTGFGAAASPILAGNLVLLNGQGNDLHLLAVDAATGKTAWKTQGSPFPSHYPVPVLWKQGPITEVVVLGRGGLLAFDVKDGSKRWWIPGLSPEATPTPTLGEGMLFVASHLPGGDPDLRMKLPPFDDMLKQYDKNKDGKLSSKEIPTDLLILSRGGKDGRRRQGVHRLRCGRGHRAQSRKSFRSARRK